MNVAKQTVHIIHDYITPYSVTDTIDADGNIGDEHLGNHSITMDTHEFVLFISMMQLLINSS